MFGAFEQTETKKRQPPTDVQALEKKVKPDRSAKKQQIEELSEENKSEESDRDEDQIIKNVEDLIKSKDVENSTLKLGYNESDY